jgi:hydrogenase maturation protease
MEKIMVIGYGNPLRGDDGLGWHAAQQLDRSIHIENVEIISCHQLTPEMAEPVSKADFVIFIDARWGDVPGKICCRPVEVGLSSHTDSKHTTLSHYFDPPTLIALAQGLYGRRPEAFVLSVSSQAFGYVEGLSPSIQAALPMLLGRVGELIDKREEA